MFRQKTGSVVCASCGSLVGVNDETCYTCGRRNPGLWGFGPVLRRFGNDLGFVTLVIYGCAALYTGTLLMSLAFGENIMGGSLFSLLGPGSRSLFLFGASGAIPVVVYDRWWTILSAGWLHGGALHIIFNIMWVRNLGPAVGDLYGAARMIIIYTIAGASGFLLSSLAGAYLRAARRARLLRPPRRQQHGAVRGDELRGHAVRLRPDHAGRRRRQLRP